MTDKLSEFESKFAKNRENWTKSDWKLVALTLAFGEEIQPAKRGRPKKAADQAPSLISAEVNYEALAFQVQVHMAQTGSGNIKEAVRDVMRKSAELNKQGKYRVTQKIDTTYAAVRKILAAWRKDSQKAGK